MKANALCPGHLFLIPNFHFPNFPQLFSSLDPLRPPFAIGRCGACQAWMQEWISTPSGGANASSTPSPTASEDARDALFLDHVIRLATYLGDKYPKVRR